MPSSPAPHGGVFVVDDGKQGGGRIRGHAVRCSRVAVERAEPVVSRGTRYGTVHGADDGEHEVPVANRRAEWRESVDLDGRRAGCLVWTRGMGSGWEVGFERFSSLMLPFGDGQVMATEVGEKTQPIMQQRVA